MAKVVLENVEKAFPSRPGATTSGKPEPGSPSTAGSAASSAANAAQLDRSAPSISVLKHINLTIQDGEFLVLVGPSGCGKSTLLRLIAGLETLTNGEIWVGDRPVHHLPPKARDIAMVFQSYALYPHLSVYDNIAFGLRRGQGQPAPPVNPANSDLDPSASPVPPKPHSSPHPLQRWGQQLRFSLTRSLPTSLRYLPPQEAAIQTQVTQVAHMLQIETLLQRFPRQLSGGQKQRVALGRAIARNPQVFLMDEPLSNLDAKLRAETRSQIVQLQQQLGTTTLYVTHDQVEAMTMGQRIALMNQGHLEQVATPLDLYRTPATRFVASFIGSPPMNFITVQLKSPATIVHHQFRFTLPDPWLPQIQPYLDQTVTLGIRPEHFDLGSSAVKNLPVVIDRIESLGSDTYLTVHLTESLDSLQVRADPERVFRLGQLIHLSLRLEHIHLFDPHTDRALAHGPALAHGSAF
ncbi:MAG: ATP-binding cassette domain-containing protein [Prochlorothrix sp.]|nr:ATP-binding cassette domain-containing protein [Prochlorothrix sp.]